MLSLVAIVKEMTMKTMVRDGAFQKSSFSREPGVHCVEVARKSDGTIVVRDSKNPDGGALHFNGGEWDAFIQGVNAGEFNN